MIECIFTIDYEIYGNGDGSLRRLIYEPAEHLMALFLKQNKRFVAFVECAELEMIEKHQTDEAIGDIRRQINTLYQEGFEIGLHLHPQWYNARSENGTWILDYSEYNLCRLPQGRIDELIQRAIDYLRDILQSTDLTPLAYRAGNWLLQPTGTMSSVLAAKGLKIDSSVFKGGLQRGYGLDYRSARGNGYYWRFGDNVNVHDPEGRLIELPTYTIMVPTWKMITRKRVGMLRKGPSTSGANGGKLNRYLDFLRFRYPLKLDFCRMTSDELTRVMDAVISEDKKNPAFYKPIVAIGHTKDLTDLSAVQSFLRYLDDRGIPASTFETAHRKCDC